MKTLTEERHGVIDCISRDILLLNTVYYSRFTGRGILPEMAYLDETQPSVSVSNDISSRSPNISIEDISPLPVSSVVTKNRKPRKGRKHGVLNNTPEIKIAKTIIAEKEAETLRKSAREAKRKLVIEESEEGIEDVSVEDDEEDDPACLYCNGLYRLSCAHEDWIRCQKCNRWCQSECAGVSRRVKQFICDVCK
ncbi:hypothetical protein FQA39_LY05297 [Lamprigera yunnana]|nr:hypothetical protein FQA39_LY05297 [Lamprigera yunnana]